MADLSERLGLAPGARAVIVSCDELGFAHAANAAIFEALALRRTTSASLMVPAPWARAATADYRGEDVGVHLTLNAELDLYRWAPITQAPSLLDGEGAFPRTIEDVWEHADLDEVRREWRAQIERAVLWGFHITHLDTHLGGVELKPEFFDVYLELAEEFRLPVRLPGIEAERRIGFPFRAVAAERGIVAPDQVVALGELGNDVPSIVTGLGALTPGVTEVHAHPAIDTLEIRSADPDWPARVHEHEILGAIESIVHGAKALGVEFIAYRSLTALARGELRPSR
jgi:chitin disaccharide deacetylase